ncbi:SDR family NAD(P)-dependent oxidoreductase [Halegenticoccus tardaugens]|uniref:SDR family NAD(P)-dependent oxidoreductase n=1 Tax=Halegenticoccus tardaugens TaxID=2071624 RepID=UPI00100ACDA7|nr:SDR family oxidoreductase [Halegenticoccus tardaugens]
MTRHGLLDGDVAIVTGAGRNIGRAIAATFATEGAKVVVVDLNEERAHQTAEILRGDDAEAMAVTADVSSEADAEAMVEVAEEEFGGVDVLVNNAAVTERTDFFDLSVEEFERTLRVNLLGTFLCTRAAAASMRYSSGGRIVNFASTSAHVARPNAAAYASSKSGVLSFTKTAANALAEHGIRVNAISPTRTGSRVGNNERRSGDPDADILVGRWGRPEDQANAALFLASPMSAFVNGTELVVDGGAQASTYDR